MGRKIYLSLDDLNKLYGLSPSIINAIKTKRKKRRNKKHKIDNSTMGNKASSSDHMVGSSTALSIATQQLNQSNINKRIEDINKSNEIIKNKQNLMIEDKKTEDIPIVIQNIYKKLKNNELLTPNETIEYENIKNIMIQSEIKPKKNKTIRGRKSWIDPEIITQNPLSSKNQSNIMNRNESNNNINISDSDNVGIITAGTSSDNFLNNAEEYLEPEVVDIPIVDLSVNESIIDLPVNESIVEETKDDLTNEQQPEITYKTIDEFNSITDLRQIAIDNNIKYKKNITKKPLYNLLLKEKLIPIK